MATLLGALLRNESGGRNIVQGDIGDINNRTGDLAKGYFQITTGTWRDFAKQAGIDTNQYPDAMSAPYAVQAKMASVIPLARWGPNTITAMRATGMPIDLHRTLGENLSMNNEGFGSAPPVQGSGTGSSAPVYGQQPVVHAPSQPGGPLAAQDVAATTAPQQGPQLPAAQKIAAAYPVTSPGVEKQGPVIPAQPAMTAAAEDPYSWKSLRKKLGEAMTGYKMPAMAKNDTNLAGLAMPAAARVDTPELPSFDPNQIADQRQQLAMAMQKLNTGRLF